MWKKILQTDNSIALAIARLGLGLVMFPHGAQKLLGWFGGPGFNATLESFNQHSGIPAPLACLAIAAEFFGGLGLILGCLGRVAGFGILCTMVVAVLTVHLPFGFFMNWAGGKSGEGFEYHLLAIALAAAVVAGGSGAMSVDRWMSTEKPTRLRAVPDRSNYGGTPRASNY